MIYAIKNKVRSWSHSNEILGKLYRLANRIKVNSLTWVSDERFAKMKYKENRGLTLNLEKPERFNEKLWWLKLNNRDPLLTKCSDKYQVRDYVKEAGLEHILVDLYGVYDDANDIDFEKIPRKAFIKTNHGSGINILWDRNKKFDKEKFIKTFNKSLEQNYYLQSREWNYKNIKPRIIVEKELKNKDNSPLIDYKFMCFNGEVKLVFVELGIILPDGTQNPYSTRNVYDQDFNFIDVKVRREHFDKKLVGKPNNFEKMVKYAEILSEPFPHVRVDLYNINGEIYFGEMTFYNDGASARITPDEWDYQMGEWINLESDKISLEDNA